MQSTRQTSEVWAKLLSSLGQTAQQTGQKFHQTAQQFGETAGQTADVFGVFSFLLFKNRCLFVTKLSMSILQFVVTFQKHIC